MPRSGQRIHSSRWSNDHPGERERRSQGEGIQTQYVSEHSEAGSNRLQREGRMLNVTEEMKHLHKLARRHPTKRFNKLWLKLIDREWLIQAWEELRRNRGSHTAGIDAMTAIDVDMNLINQLAQELKTNRYRPTPV